MDDVAVWMPSLDAWDQFVWPPVEVEQYSYRCGQAIDLRPVMPVTQFRVTDEVGTYLCAVQTLVFEESVLAYNPTRDEAEWVPACVSLVSWPDSSSLQEEEEEDGQEEEEEHEEVEEHGEVGPIQWHGAQAR